MGGNKPNRKSKDKILLPPELPPDVPDEDIQVSDEDLKFVRRNKKYAGFVSSLDTKSITKHVSRSANAKEDELTALRERRWSKKNLGKEEEKGLEVDRVNALPVKTLDGQLVYRTVSKAANKPVNVGKEGEHDGDEEGDVENNGVLKLNKAERRAKLKKTRKEEKKQAKEPATTDEVPQDSQSEILAEVKEEFSAAEIAESKQQRMAELGTALLENPESNIKSLKDLLSFCKDGDKVIAKAALLSALVVFRDVIPGYRIRLPTEKEQEMNISKVVKKMRYFESTLLSSYKMYIQRLVTLLRLPEFHRVAVRCLCTLLDAHPHFNYREQLLQPVVQHLSSSDDVVRKLCSETVRSLFTNVGKHGGEATVDAVQLISELVRIHECQLHPDSIEVFLALSFDEDLRRPEKTDDKAKGKHKNNKRKWNPKEENQPAISDKKKSKRELQSKTREEVNADYKAASFAQDERVRRRIQTETLSAVFNTYFRVLKHAIQPAAVQSSINSNSTVGPLGAYPLLSPCLKGLGMFAHLIDLDYMADLLKHLQVLASGATSGPGKSPLTVTERIECCIVAFRVMRKNLDALNVDLQDFYIHLYNLIVEFRPERDQGAALAEALKIILCDDRQHDMQRAAAFIKRLATSSLCFGSAETMAALVTVRNLLQKNVKCRYLLENDVGGGSVAGSVVRYQPYATDPHLSGALASVLWELNLLTKHCHPSVKEMASGISQIHTNPNHVYKATETPLQVYKKLKLEKETFDVRGDLVKVPQKRKSSRPLTVDDAPSCIDEEELKKKFGDHFTVVHDIVENERLRKELDLTTVSLQLHEEYKKRRSAKK